jgi:phosphopantetheine adenylyltransferase
MTIKQLESRIVDLEREVADLKNKAKSSRTMSSIQETFGMFADDPEFDEIVRFGREYRRQANAEGS